MISEIEKIRTILVNKSRPAEITGGPNNLAPQDRIVIGKHQPIYLLPAAALSLLVGINYLADASTISDNIDDVSDIPGMGKTVDNMESQMNRYKIVGYGALLASAALVYVSFHSFDIYATPNKIKVSMAIN